MPDAARASTSRAQRAGSSSSGSATARARVLRSRSASGSHSAERQRWSLSPSQLDERDEDEDDEAEPPAVVSAAASTTAGTPSPRPEPRPARRQMQADESVEFIEVRPPKRQRLRSPSVQAAAGSSRAVASVEPISNRARSRSNGLMTLDEENRLASGLSGLATPLRGSVSPVKTTSTSPKGKGKASEQPAANPANVLEEAEPILEGSTPDQLRAEMLSLRHELASKNEFIEATRSTVDATQSAMTCHVCFDLAWRPQVLTCGHVFCARCLIDWFKKPLQDELGPPAHMRGAERTTYENRATRKRKKICPGCRARVINPPIELFAVKDLLETIDKAVRAGQGRGGEGEEEPDAEAKGETLPAGAALWQNIFSDGPPPPPIIHDLEDGVDRCGVCTSEVVGGYCQNADCGHYYSEEDDGDGDDFDDGHFEPGAHEYLANLMGAHHGRAAPAGRRYDDVAILTDSESDDNSVDEYLDDEDRRDHEDFIVDSGDEDADDQARLARHRARLDRRQAARDRRDIDRARRAAGRANAPIVLDSDSSDGEVQVAGEVRRPAILPSSDEEDLSDSSSGSQSDSDDSGSDGIRANRGMLMRRARLEDVADADADAVDADINAVDGSDGSDASSDSHSEDQFHDSEEEAAEPARPRLRDVRQGVAARLAALQDTVDRIRRRVPEMSDDSGSAGSLSSHEFDDEDVGTPPRRRRGRRAVRDSEEDDDDDDQNSYDEAMLSSEEEAPLSPQSRRRMLADAAERRARAQS